MEGTPDVFGITIPMGGDKHAWIGFHNILFKGKEKMDQAIQSLRKQTPKDFEHFEEEDFAEKEEDDKEEICDKYDWSIITFIFARLVSLFIKKECLIDFERDGGADPLASLEKETDLLLCSSGTPLHSMEVIKKLKKGNYLDEDKWFQSVSSKEEKSSKMKITYMNVDTIEKCSIFETTSFSFQEDDIPVMLESIITLAIHYATLFKRLGMDPMKASGLFVSPVSVERNDKDASSNAHICLSVLWFSKKETQSKEMPSLTPKQIAIMRLMRVKEAVVCDGDAQDAFIKHKEEMAKMNL